MSEQEQPDEIPFGDEQEEDALRRFFAEVLLGMHPELQPIDFGSIGGGVPPIEWDYS